MLSVLALAAATGAQGESIELRVERRDAHGSSFSETVRIDPKHTAIVESDIWDRHWDVVMSARVESIIPRVNEGYQVARQLGIAIIHAQADIPTPPDDTAMRRYISSIPDAPLPQYPGTGFFIPMVTAPYYDNVNGDMIPPGVVAPGQSPPQRVWNGPHPDLSIEDSDIWIDAAHWTHGYYGGANTWSATSRDLQEMWNLVKDRQIDTLIFTGGATNISALYKGFGMMEMKRLGVRVLVATDMSFTWSDNGEDDRTGLIDPSITPDKGDREINGWIEQYFDGTFKAAELLRYAPKFAYTAQVSREDSILSYWRLDGKRNYTHVQDINRMQGAWHDPQVSGVTLGVDGALSGDDDTAAHFDGVGALIVAPMFRGDTPASSEIRSLAQDSFTIEAWVKPEKLNRKQVVISMDDGTPKTIGFLLQITKDNKFEFITHGSKSRVAGGHVKSLNGRWFHIVAVQDNHHRTLRLYVDGAVVGETALEGTAPDVKSAVLIGGRGPIEIANGEGHKGNDGAVIAQGGDFFHGVLDDISIYHDALSPEVVMQHYSLGSSGSPTLAP